MAFRFSLNDKEHTVDIAARRPELTLHVDGRARQVSEATALSDDCVLLTVDGRSYQLWRTCEGTRIHVRIGRRTFSIDYEDAIHAAQHGADDEDVLRAEMPGVVVETRCATGDEVGAGDILMVIESMKMQINIVAPRDGSVESLHLDANSSFEKGAELISLAAEDPN